jgi:chorismate mutase/prephenate dehydratase
MAKAKGDKKKLVPRPKGPSAESGVSAAGLRSRIERLDRELLISLHQRAALAIKLHKLASEEQGPLGPFSPQRGDQLSILMARKRGPMPDRCIRAVFRELLSGCRALIQERRIAFMGPLYSYSHLAAIHGFGQSVEFVPVGSIAAVFEEVNRAHSHFGLVPIENSTDGRIADTLDMFTRLPVRICGEVEMQIHHALLGKCPRTEVQEVYSRPQALSQCRNWLAKHLPAARTIEVTSTSTAAQLAKEKPGAAAIASLQAGVHYELEVLAERIEDNPGNATRFAVIGDRSAQRTGRDKTAMMFQTEHRPGALAEAMGVFKRNRLNLTWIESFPVPEQRGAYLFFVEMEGHETDNRVRRAAEALARRTLRLEILGSFPVSNPVE